MSAAPWRSGLRRCGAVSTEYLSAGRSCGASLIIGCAGVAQGGYASRRARRISRMSLAKGLRPAGRCSSSPRPWRSASVRRLVDVFFSVSCVIFFIWWFAGGGVPPFAPQSPAPANRERGDGLGLGWPLLFVIFFHFAEDKISSPLPLRSRLNDQLCIFPKLLQPALDIGCRSRKCVLNA
jgi:hypothetical protein